MKGMIMNLYDQIDGAHEVLLRYGQYGADPSREGSERSYMIYEWQQDLSQRSSIR